MPELKNPFEGQGFFAHEPFDLDGPDDDEEIGEDQLVSTETARAGYAASVARHRAAQPEYWKKKDFRAAVERAMLPKHRFNTPLAEWQQLFNDTARMLLAFEKEWPFDDGYWSDTEHESNTVYVAHPILCENETVMISAHAKSGKTLIAHTIALHVANGIDFGQIKIPSQRGALYFALESRKAIRQRNTAFRRYMRQELPLQRDWPLFTPEASVNLTTQTARTELADKITKADAFMRKRWNVSLGLIVFDTLTKLMPGGDQNSVADTSLVLSVVDDIRKRGVVACIVVLHHRSRNGNTRGSTNLEADPDTLTYASKEKNVIDWWVDRARSVSEDIRFKFQAVEYDLGINAQGFRDTAPLLFPHDGETDKGDDDDAMKDWPALHRRMAGFIREIETPCKEADFLAKLREMERAFLVAENVIKPDQITSTAKNNVRNAVIALKKKGFIDTTEDKMVWLRGSESSKLAENLQKNAKPTPPPQK